jgi:hypothetical protein
VSKSQSAPSSNPDLSKAAVSLGTGAPVDQHEQPALLLVELVSLGRGLKTAKDVVSLNHHLPTAQRDEANCALEEASAALDRIWGVVEERALGAKD